MEYTLLMGAQYGDCAVPDVKFDGMVLKGAAHVIHEVIDHLDNLTG